MAQYKRKKLFVAPKVQGLLIARVVAYWIAAMVTLEFIRLTWQITFGPEQAGFLAYFTSYDWLAAGGRMLFASLLLIPIIWDMLVFSNRFAGPVFRMRRVLREVAQGRVVARVKLRDGDLWHGFADDLNAALQRVAPQQLAQTPADIPRLESADDIAQDVTKNDVGLTDSLAILR